MSTCHSGSGLADPNLGGVPIYQRLQSGSKAGATATPGEIALALSAVLVMQAAHWLSLPLRRGLPVPRNVVLCYVLVWIGELSLFFAAALTTLIVFDRFGEWEFLLWKFLLLCTILFAITSYKYQLMSLGALMIEAKR